MRLTAATDARLLGARSPVAGIVEIHEMALENNVMRMREISRLDLPAGRTVELRPGGYHVMLLDLKRTLKPGEEVPITLEIEQGGKRMSVQVKAIVRPLTSATTAPKH
jgi:copper(I)-binding protein